MTHAHHHHHETAGMGDGRLLLAIAANLLLTVAQVIGGLVSGSLSLVADALHNLNDAAALALALIARRVGRKPADAVRTFGYRKAEVIGALINTTALILVGLYLIYEAVERLLNPQTVNGWIMVAVAGAALLVDVGTALLTRAMARDSINIRAAFIHNVADALGSLAVMIVGALILLFGWYLADVVATLLLAGFILYQSLGLLRQSVRILMDSVPVDMDMMELKAAMEAEEGVSGVHHLHVWQLDEHHRALEAHVVLESADFQDAQITKSGLKRFLHERFAINHTTLEMEPPGNAADQACPELTGGVQCQLHGEGWVAD